MRTVTRLLTILGAVGGAVWVSRARARARASDRPLSVELGRDLRGFVTHRFDPLVMQLGLAGGRMSPWAVIEHVGRTSGTVHRTPVTPRVHGDHVYIPLPYGVDVQWVRNVEAAGHCRIQSHDMLYELDEPRVVTPDDVATLSPTAHEVLDMSGAHYLRLHILERVPGAFARPPAEFTTHPPLEGVMPIQAHPAEAISDSTPALA